ncbi:YLP motif-containing protein 1 isoform X1 [Pistacia vera]|uniref:YLP motif-containing protein 1 isoform X1 n=1 Tax=Pistacia vera TaxID=55513 RepID=UPI00126316D6|nr:YLP motif-containing protein 1 isoform X1 [Pistacia vera]
MDHQQWHFRPPPPANNICPICYISHFPFCPPPPPPPPPYANQNPRFPPHPGFDPRTWHGVNPNFEGPNPVPPVYDYYGGTNGFVSEYDRNYNNKRMRIDENNYQSPDHERRLKLIRDHGCASGNPEFFNRNGVYSAENHAANNSVHVNHDWQSYGPNNQPPPTALPLPLLPPPHHGWQHQNYCNGNEHLNTPGGYLSHHTGNGIGQPPLPTSPPPPLPVDPPLPHLPQPPPPPKTSLFPVPLSRPSSYPPISHASAEFLREESRSLSMPYLGESQSFPLKQLSPEKPKVVNALQLFKQPHRATRPDHIVIILRGLPGSGKSYLAKMLRDLEVENGGDAPRIHSMDDYFMTEVEKIEEGDVSKSSSSIRSKKPITKKVMEYCYEPEMEEAYRLSMLKAFKRTLEEGNFTFVIVDDRNLRVADFAQFWAFAKRSGYEVYILEATYKDPAGCAARNVHGFTFDAIEKMAGQWEEAPSLYLQLDIKSLFHGDDLKKSGIKEVDMDLEDEDIDEGLSAQQEILSNNITVVGDQPPSALDSPSDGKRWDAESDHPTQVVKDLGSCKWSDDLEDDDAERSKVVKGNLNSLSGLFQTYGREGKSVRWGDQVGDTGFSIGAAKNADMLSLVIGPGAGYNLKSNPLTKEERSGSMHSVGKSEKQSSFQEHLRAERESFKAVFDRRRQRIGGLDLEEEG